MNLSDAREIRQLMEEAGTGFQKKYGQNFLINREITKRIAEQSGGQREDAVLEIGPGIGTLTQFLCEQYKKVVAVEIDAHLIPILEKTLKPYDNVTILNADIMKADLDSLWKKHFSGMSVSVCANLPYYITTPVLMKLLESRLPLDFITVMIQKEVADRLCASPGTPEYGAVTVAVQYFGKIEKLFSVSAGNFLPAPKVDSTVIRIRMLKEPSVFCQEEALFFHLVRSAFGQRRKTLKNALSSALNDYDRDTIADAIRSVGLSPEIRGECLSLRDFANLSNVLSSRKAGPGNPKNQSGG